MTFKETAEKVLGPSYDPMNDEIKGCEEGTLTYFHEEGHRRQRETGITALYSLLIPITGGICTSGIILYLCGYMKSHPTVFPFLYWGVIPFTFMFWYIEIDAWIYAFKKQKKLKEKKK